MKGHELAQLNIARPLEPLESERLSGFVANLERINTLAESSPGFVWRLQDEDGDATSIRPFGEDYVVNLTVWDGVHSLHNFVYRSAHVEVMRRRKEWFSPMKEAFTVLWWVPAGHRPGIVEASERLECLRKNGASSEAFTFKEALSA